jgi:hypothetical protein
MQGIKVGPPGCQKVKQPLPVIPAFIANGKNCAMHKILDGIVRRTIDGLPDQTGAHPAATGPFSPGKDFK